MCCPIMMGDEKNSMKKNTIVPFKIKYFSFQRYFPTHTSSYTHTCIFILNPLTPSQHDFCNLCPLKFFLKSFEKCGDYSYKSLASTFTFGSTYPLKFHQILANVIVGYDQEPHHVILMLLAKYMFCLAIFLVFYLILVHPFLLTTTSTIVLTYVDFNNLEVTLIVTIIKNLNSTYKEQVL